MHELDVLRRELSHLELVDATGLFSRLRMIKTPAEIACLRRAVQIQNGAFRIFASRISRRMTESDLIFEMVRAQGEARATDLGFVANEPSGSKEMRGYQRICTHNSALSSSNLMLSSLVSREKVSLRQEAMLDEDRADR